jgi:hypothetical protein
MAQTNDQMSKEQQIGYHKGSIAVLSKEREEMLKIAAITEQLMNMHVKALQDLGVDITKEQQAAQQPKEAPKKKVPIEHLI